MTLILPASRPAVNDKRVTRPWSEISPAFESLKVIQAVQPVAKVKPEALSGIGFLEVVVRLAGLEPTTPRFVPLRLSPPSSRMFVAWTFSSP